MAAITPVTAISRLKVLQTAATTTTTDWVDVPLWAETITIHLDVSATGGSVGLAIKQGNPVSRDDARTIPLGTQVAKTAATYSTYTITPIGTTVADAAGASTAAIVLAPVPSLIGLTTTVTTSGTYSTAIEFKKL